VEVLGVNRVHFRVVLLEVREEHARRDDLLETEAAAREHALEVLHYLPGLRLDSLRVRRGARGSGERHLARHEHPAVDLDRVAERRDRVRRAVDHVE
jgi:hypothetical protein